MGEKKRRLSALPPGGAPFDGRLLARAFEALEAGDRVRAAVAFETFQANLPDDADALNAIGVLGLRLGDPERALTPLVRAVEANPRAPAIRCHLAIAYRSLAQPHLAVAELQAALSLDPLLAEAHSNLGNLLLERNDHAAAEASFARALALKQNYPFALFGLGEARLAQGRADEACADFERALALDPSLHEALYGLSRARSAIVAELERADGAVSTSPAVVLSADSALESIVAALSIAHENPAYWTQFERCVKEFDLRHPVDSRVRDLLFRALGHSAVDPARLVRPIVSLVATRPDAVELRRRLSGPGTADAPPWSVRKDDVRGLLGDALLQRLLEAVIVPSLFVERLVAFARRGLLEEFGIAPSVPPSLPLPSIVAMAHQCHATEYVHDETDAESRGVAVVRAAMGAARQASSPVPLHWYALYACYRPLHTLDEADAIAAELAPTALASLATTQIREPLEERRLRGTIVAMTAVADEISVAVQSQYEANPYPRWLRVERDVAHTSVAEFLRTLFPAAGLGRPSGRAHAHPCRGLRHGTPPDRHGAAISRFERARRRFELDEPRVRGAQDARARDRQHRIPAGGHPGAGSDRRTLRCRRLHGRAASPRGSGRGLADPVLAASPRRRDARRVVQRARSPACRSRARIHRGGGLRAHTVRHSRLPRGDTRPAGRRPLLARVAQGEDFYSLSGCRDLIFHVQEERFTLPRIASVLDELELDFVGFEWPDNDTPARYRARFPTIRRSSISTTGTGSRPTGPILSC